MPETPGFYVVIGENEPLVHIRFARERTDADNLRAELQAEQVEARVVERRAS